MRRLIERALAAAGYRSRLACDGYEGLRRLAEAPARLILTDVNMPGMDGLAFIAAVRRDPCHACTPILVVTTEAEADLRAAGRAAGATGWIVKPFEPRRLCQVVGAVLAAAGEGAGGPGSRRP